MVTVVTDKLKKRSVAKSSQQASKADEKAGNHSSSSSWFGRPSKEDATKKPRNKFYLYVRFTSKAWGEYRNEEGLLSKLLEAIARHNKHNFTAVGAPFKDDPKDRLPKDVPVNPLPWHGLECETPKSIGKVRGFIKTFTSENSRLSSMFVFSVKELDSSNHYNPNIDRENSLSSKIPSIIPVGAEEELTFARKKKERFLFGAPRDNTTKLPLPAEESKSNCSNLPTASDASATTRSGTVKPKGTEKRLQSRGFGPNEDEK